MNTLTPRQQSSIPLHQALAIILGDPSLSPHLEYYYKHVDDIDLVVEALEDSIFDLSPQMHEELQVLFGEDKVNIVFLHLLNILNLDVDVREIAFLQFVLAPNV